MGRVLFGFFRVVSAASLRSINQRLDHFNLRTAEGYLTNASIALFGKNPSRSRHGSAVIEKMIEKMTEEMKEKLDVSISTVNREIAALKKKRALDRKGGDKDGQWVVLV